MHKLFSKVRGFTLIELMVVIAIIGLLAAIITTSLVSSRAKSRDAKRVADIKTLQLALETYYNDNSVYPLTLISLAPNYIPSLPSDPNSTVQCVNGNETGCYLYNTFNANASSNCGSVGNPSATNPIVKYHLGAAMESTAVTNAQTFLQDSDWWVSGASPPAPYGICSGGTGKGSFYGISNGCISTSGGIDSCYDVTN